MKKIANDSGRTYLQETDNFDSGICACMEAVGVMIGESVVNGVYDLIPDTSCISR